MRLSQLVGHRFKETPRDAATKSHEYLLRGGYGRQVSAGIYSLLPLGRRITRKIEGIIREEMNRISGQEVKMPVVLPAELWEESGRYETVGPELLRFKDRNQKEMLLGMTHEEAVVHMVRSDVKSHKQLPVMLYQIQTKYRDEARPRAGLIRVREFTMKDGYSFHTSFEDLAEYYVQCHEAYERIFDRIGMKEVVSIRSDTGMMGGKEAHEFMAITEVGEDTIFISEDGQYKANREVATSSIIFEAGDVQPLEKVHTPGKKTIEDVATFLGVETSQTGKAVFYQTAEGELVFVVVRGDFEVNEIKLANILKTAELTFAEDDKIRAAGAVPGYASPMNVDLETVKVVFDPSASQSSNLVVGANETDYHYKNFNFKREMADLADKVIVADIATVRAGDPDPVNGSPLLETRGIEVGNIFQLGTKYSEAMDCKYLGPDGKLYTMIMGCYGIGVERAMAAVIEQSHDKWGPIWPANIAPYQVHICALNINQDNVGQVAEDLYRQLTDLNIEVLFDDRNEKAGVAFAEADLIGIPNRIIISKKTLAEQQMEFKTRDGSVKEMVALDEMVAFIQQRVAL
jgi:prolyl-tRNA synthetase